MMSTFKSLRVQGFRRLVDVKLELRPRALTVMIGANGCGKSSLLEAWHLLARSAEGKLRDEAKSLGDLHQLITKSGPGIDSDQKLAFEVQLVDRDDQYDYLVRVIDPSAFEETLTKTTSGQQKKLLLGKYLNSATSRIQETKLFDSRNEAEVEPFQQRLASCELFRPIAMATVRDWQSSSPADSPGLHGETLLPYLQTVEARDPDRFEMIEDTLRAAFPQFERLGFKEVIPGRLAMSWKEAQFTDPIYMTQLSEGTLRFLWLTSLLLRRDLPAVMLIDEPELSLHPQLLLLLVDLMREASLRTQLIVATQSDQLVRFLTPEEVLVADVEEGATRFTWGDDLDLDHWLKDFTLDQLWTMGVLGGRP